MRLHDLQKGVADVVGIAVEKGIPLDVAVAAVRAVMDNIETTSALERRLREASGLDVGPETKTFAKAREYGLDPIFDLVKRAAVGMFGDDSVKTDGGEPIKPVDLLRRMQERGSSTVFSADDVAESKRREAFAKFNSGPIALDYKRNVGKFSSLEMQDIETGIASVSTWMRACGVDFHLRPAKDGERHLLDRRLNEFDKCPDCKIRHPQMKDIAGWLDLPKGIVAHVIGDDILTFVEKVGA